jgi:hypothetical protein
MELFRTNYSSAVYLAELKCIEFTRFQSETMTDEIYKTEMLRLVDSLRQHKPQYVLMDNKNFKFVISPETQTWVNTNILAEAGKLGIQGVLFIISDELFSQISVEQAMEDAEGKKIKTHYFPSKELAYAHIRNLRH